MPAPPPTGYSGTPLAKKLGLKPGHRLAAPGAPPHYRSLLAPLPERVELAGEPDAGTDVFHLFTTSRTDLAEALGRWRALLRPDASIWVSWPKKAAKVPTDVTEDTIRAVALPLGFVDIKVCAVDETWSGLKLVIRRELR